MHDGWGSVWVETGRALARVPIWISMVAQAFG